MREVQWERLSLHVSRSEVGENFVSLFRSCGDSDVCSRKPHMGHSCGAMVEHACETLATASQPVLDALRWATGLKGDKIVAALAGSLPLAAQDLGCAKAGRLLPSLFRKRRFPAIRAA